MIAASNGHLSIVAELLEHGAIKLANTNIRGWTAESVARMHNRHNVANFIRNYGVH